MLGLAFAHCHCCDECDESCTGPTPGPSGGAFTQKQCSDANCSAGCRSAQFPQGQCLKTSSGGSAEVSCSADGKELVTREFTSTDCTGTAKNSTEPTDKCLKSSSGGYFENTCPSTASFAILTSPLVNVDTLKYKV